MGTIISEHGGEIEWQALNIYLEEIWYVLVWNTLVPILTHISIYNIRHFDYNIFGRYDYLHWSIPLLKLHCVPI